MTDTIYAVSTAPGRSAIAVIRISGVQAAVALDRFGIGMIVPRVATNRLVKDGKDVIDSGLVLWFPGPHSATGEDIVEVQVHGSPAVARRLLAVLSTIPGFRPAEAGEFTHRAFLAGKLDLLQVEGLDDLLAAETDVQRRYAAQALTGTHRDIWNSWREGLLEARALTEAMIDFADEDDAPIDTRESVLSMVLRLRNDMVSVRASVGSSERLRDGVTVVLIGAPNAGKSSLFNALIGRPAAIVTAEPGTTRDVLEVRLDLGGLPLTLVDTAGLRESDSVVEREGIRRAREMAARADIVLHLWAPDVSDPDTDFSGGPRRLIRIRTKSDLPDGGGPGLPVSAATGAGLDALLELLRSEVEAVLFGRGEPLVMLRARQERALNDAIAALGDALSGDAAKHAEVFAEDLRRAGDAIGRFTGAIGVEDVLGTIFSRFCIGK
jgi:tRNA modification GTPase